jgi:hypothetical protein
MKNKEVVETQDPDEDNDSPPCFPKNDIWVLDTEIIVWTRVVPINQQTITPRFTHSAEIYKVI